MALTPSGAGPPRFDGLRAAIEIESERDQVTSDIGLGNDGCRYATLWSHSCWVSAVGSRYAWRGKGLVVDQNGISGVASDPGLDKSRRGSALATGAAVSTGSG
jgi:hypothetical protein